MSKIIEVQDLNYTYLPGSKQEHKALKNISLSLNRGEFLGIFGPNGSGKSTLAQHFNGLLQPTSGKMWICGMDTSEKEVRHQLWKKAGLVFQYPEQQIFEATVFDEIAYGPKNLGLEKEDIKESVYESLQKVGFTPEKTEYLTPMSLSGGMRRRVAIAGVLSLRSEILILDEPMAGLDPIGRKLILNIIKERKEKQKATTVMISHSLKDILALADKIAVLDKGNLVFYGDVKDLLSNRDLMTHYNLELPDYLQAVYLLAAKGFKVNTNIENIREAGLEISRLLKEIQS